jgi:hypothetical protein
LEDIIVFIGTLGRTEPADTVSAVLIPDPLKILGHRIQGLVPCGFHKSPVLLDQGCGEPVFVVDIFKTELPFHTQHPVIRAIFFHRCDTYNLSIFGMECDAAAAATVITDGLDLPGLPGAPLETGGFAGQGSHGACGNTVSAELTVEHPVVGRGDFRLEPPFGKVHGPHPLDLVTHPDAPSAEDALVVVPFQQGVDILNFMHRFFPFKAHLGEAEFIGQVLQFTPSVLFTDHALIGVVGKDQFDDGLPVLPDALCAASRMVLPGSASISFPSIKTFMIKPQGSRIQVKYKKHLKTTTQPDNP